MTNLVIDIGNTLTKVAVFNDRDINELQFFENLDAVILEEYLRGKKIDHAIISTVEKDITDLEHLLQSLCTYFRFSTVLSRRVKNRYKTPGTLGLDRYAAVIGAETIYPSKNSLVIDSGSCITYDFINSEGEYYGGSISPGIKMRFQAMHTFTERLPLVEPDFGFAEEYGTDTRSSLLSGVQNGVWNEALGFIQMFASHYPDLKILLCGGDVKFFDSRLKNSIFADAVKTEPNLVLIGLNEVIYQQND
jgi:type III pantothenate kinase